MDVGGFLNWLPPAPGVIRRGGSFILEPGSEGLVSGGGGSGLGCDEGGPAEDDGGGEAFGDPGL
jgi:hypothetical protein